MLNFSDLVSLETKKSTVIAEEVAVEEAVEVTTGDHVKTAEVVAVVVADAEERISRSSMKRLSQLSEAVATAKAASKVNNKSLDKSRAF